MAEQHESLEVVSRADLRAWLDANHATSRGVWVVTYKKDQGPYVGYEAVVEEALAFGWIDSLARRLDERRSQLLLTPRRPTGNWSMANKRRVAHLVATGLMTPAGEAAVEVAKANGSWMAIDAAERLIEPDDLTRALDASPEARRHWDTFPPSARRAILEWIGSAKRAETRERRIAQTVEDAAVGVRANQ